MDSPSPDIVVSARGLTKRYGDLVALGDLDLDIYRGEIFALLGPNGAGKTTFISIVAGLIKRSAGEVKVLGHDVERDYRITRRSIGLVPQEINFDPFFTVEEMLRFQRGYFSLPPDDAYLEELLEALDLRHKRSTNSRALSGGMKRRLLIAKALVHQPPIVFLDEPTAGVDVALRRDLWAYVERRRNQGTTFILTTHYLEEAEQLADRVGVIDHGRLRLVDSTSDLLERLGRRRLEVTLHASLVALPAELAALGVVRSDDGLRLQFTYGAEDREAVPRCLQALMQSGAAIADLHSERATLEQVFVDLIRQGRSSPVSVVPPPTGE